MKIIGAFPKEEEEEKIAQFHIDEVWVWPQSIYSKRIYIYMCSILQPESIIFSIENYKKWMQRGAQIFTPNLIATVQMHTGNWKFFFYKIITLYTIIKSNGNKKKKHKNWTVMILRTNWFGIFSMGWWYIHKISRIKYIT